MIDRCTANEISLACLMTEDMTREEILKFIDNYGKWKGETNYVKEFLQRNLKEEVIDE